MEMMLVFVVGLLLFGGKGLPDMARTLGKAIREFKKATSNVEEQFKRVLDEPPAASPPPPARVIRPVIESPSPPVSPPPPADGPGASPS